MNQEYTWKYCLLCQTAMAICPTCNNSSCNGGGCEKCLPDSEIITRMIQDGTHPEVQIPSDEDRKKWMADLYKAVTL